MKRQYPAAVEAIRSWIVRENLAPGTLLPSGRRLVAQFGFTPVITQRACQILTSEGVLTREGYKLMVRGIGRRASEIEGTIYILSYEESFSSQISRFFTERVMDHRVIGISWAKALEPVLRKTFAERPAGLILWTPGLHEKTELLLKPNCPIVICAGELRHWPHSSIQMDNFRGSEIALKHLYELGHRQIAHLSCGYDDSPRSLAECYRVNCRKLNLRESASRIWQAENMKPEGIREALLAGRRRHPKVTALFCDVSSGVCATELFSVPEELSVVGFSEVPEGIECRPPLTTMTIRDADSVALWAGTMLISQIQTIQSGRPPRPPTKTLLVPDLVLRESTRALLPKNAAPPISSRSRPKEPDPAGTWRKVYPFLKKIRTSNWLPLDLSTLTNHSFSRHHGWLGAEPLEHFPPGLRSIHGVPFQILDERQNDGRAVITFRSPHSHSAGQRELPASVNVNLNQRVKALYFLHGCGYSQPLPFAEYIMNYRRNGASRVALIPLGPSRSMALERLGDLKPNLQDWWPDHHEHQNFPHAHHVVVFNPAEPGVYQRYLYSLEWINPDPEREVDFVSVRVDPLAGPALALIAMTALLHEPKARAPKISAAI